MISKKQRAEWMDEFADGWALNVDLFSGVYCGYWARGYVLDAAPEPARWLLCEHLLLDGEDAKVSSIDAEARKVLKLARAGKKLPGGWFVLDRAVADKAYAIGEKKWGERWFEDKGDAGTYDVVIQEALLGEVRYG